MKNLARVLVLFCLGLNVTCTEKQPPMDSDPSSSARTYAKKAACSCDKSYTNPNCGDCVKTFMGNQTTLVYEAYFTSCTSNDPRNPVCNVDINKPYKVTFCYDKPGPDGECALLMQIDDAPRCIQCITTLPYCVRLVASCTENGKDLYLKLDDNDPSTGPVVEEHYTISSDPKINICCEKEDPSFPGIKYKYCCSGDLIKKI